MSVIMLHAQPSWTRPPRNRPPWARIPWTPPDYCFHCLLGCHCCCFDHRHCCSGCHDHSSSGSSSADSLTAAARAPIVHHLQKKVRPSTPQIPQHVAEGIAVPVDEDSPVPAPPQGVDAVLNEGESDPIPISYGVGSSLSWFPVATWTNVAKKWRRRCVIGCITPISPHVQTRHGMHPPGTRDTAGDQACWRGNLVASRR